jgi:hypothetical protein
MAPRIVRRTALRRPWQRWVHRGTEPADVFLCSYPKSGNTWLRFLLAQLLTGRSADFQSIDDLIPYVGGHHNAPRVLRDQGRLIKSHEPYSRFYDSAYAKLVYVIRDGRDVAVSYYHEACARGRLAGGLPEFLERFLAARLDGYGPWHEHIRGWLGHRDGRSLLEIRYEDLLETPIETLGRVADFLGLAAPDDALSEAVAANTAQEMRQRERAGGPLFPANPGGRFVRAGRAGSWKDHFSAEDLSLFLQQTDGVLAQLGYLDSNEQDG